MTFPLRDERLNRGLTLREAARRFGISATSLSMYERGATVPTPGTAKQIADFYGVQVTDIWPTERSEVAA